MAVGPLFLALATDPQSIFGWILPLTLICLYSLPVIRLTESRDCRYNNDFLLDNGHWMALNRKRLRFLQLIVVPALPGT
jgi:hypothetical protein